MAEIFHGARGSRFGTAIWAVKMVFLSVGIMSTVILFRVAVIPYANSTAVSLLSFLPAIGTCIRSWLSPPYIYIILNFIILTIAAQNHLPLPTTNSSPSKDELERTPMKGLLETNQVEKDQSETNQVEKDQPETNQIEKDQSETNHIEKPAYPPWVTGEKTEKIDIEEEEEEKTSEQPSLEETWVKIMEAQGKGQTRQLKKSDTWDTPPQVEENDPADWARRELSKSVTFKETPSTTREKSMSQEELNRRAEAFIKKFKLQRLESHQRVLNLVNAA